MATDVQIKSAEIWNRHLDACRDEIMATFVTDDDIADAVETLAALSHREAHVIGEIADVVASLRSITAVSADAE